MIKYFRFHELGADRSRYIELLGPVDKLIMPWEDLDELYEEKILPEMERRHLETRYGIHDVSFRNDTDTLWGFTSDEPEDWDALMQEWVEIWQSLGFQTGQCFIREPEDQEDQL